MACRRKARKQTHLFTKMHIGHADITNLAHGYLLISSSFGCVRPRRQVYPEKTIWEISLNIGVKENLGFHPAFDRGAPCFYLRAKNNGILAEKLLEHHSIIPLFQVSNADKGLIRQPMRPSKKITESFFGQEWSLVINWLNRPLFDPKNDDIAMKPEAIIEKMSIILAF